uniref:Uncharacterized protein n=1 Tax=Macrostomum lignano TaxID=282301 RepID=A0A1I8GY94_9PLAT
MVSMNRDAVQHERAPRCLQYSKQDSPDSSLQIPGQVGGGGVSGSAAGPVFPPPQTAAAAAAAAAALFDGFFSAGFPAVIDRT